MRTTIARVLGTLRALVGRFRRPRYVIGWDSGEDRDYWVKSRIRADGTFEIIDHGVNEHKTANDRNQGLAPKGDKA